MAHKIAVAALLAPLLVGAAMADLDATQATPESLADALWQVREDPILAEALRDSGLVGVSITSSVTPATALDLEAALARAAAISGLELGTAHREQLDDLARRLSPLQTGALVGALDAFATVETISQGIFGRLDAGPPTNQDLLPLVEARAFLLDAALGIESAFPPVSLSTAIDPGEADLEIPWLLAIDVQPCGNSFYSDDYALLIDACGDDVYFNNAGGSFNPFLPPCQRQPVLEDPVQVHLAWALSAALFDFGGSDRYGEVTGPSPLGQGHRSCGVGGGGTLASGFLLDAGGQNPSGMPDIYRGDGVAVNGGAHLGVGFLFDVAGASDYGASGQGANGGAYVAGFGTLLDFDGDDVYSVVDPLGVGEDGKGANGGGFLAGQGFLFDRGFDETFVDGEAFTCVLPFPGETCVMTPQPFGDGVGFRLDWI